MDFEWDEAKAEANLRKHGIDFDDAIGMFGGDVLNIPSDRRGEKRTKAIGVLPDGRDASVIYTNREGRRRIISARRARSNERRDYRKAFPEG